VIAIDGLTVRLAADGPPVVDDVSFTLAPGELLALVGESGAGKTTTSLALLAYARPGTTIAGGSIRIGDADLFTLDERRRARLRGDLVSYVPQNPSSSLNPSMRVGSQVAEVLAVHGHPSGDEHVRRAFEHVSLPTEQSFVRRFPHQLSGGQQQRVAIAMALACRPRLIVLDEPTTALDVITQARILALVRRLRDEGESAFVYVTHDIAAVAQVATSVAVLYAGRLVEVGPLDDVLSRPTHPYTRALVQSVPRLAPGQELVGIRGIAPSAENRPRGCAFAPRCDFAEAACEAEVPALERLDERRQVRCRRWRDLPPSESAASERRVPPQGERLLAVEHLSAAYRGRPDALVDVSFEVAHGQCLAIVGESGSGKTTLARCIAGLHMPTGGRIALDGTPLAGLARQRPREHRRRVQLVFQNPDDSLNPRVHVRDAVARPARQLRGLSRADAVRRADELLERVRLDRALGSRYPAELSGGERQRVSIARALAADPDVLVCDEVTSALDVSVQAAIVELVADLQATLGLAVVFISHDLAVVSAIADTVLVLESGCVRELGDTATVIRAPSNAYTRALLAAVPALPLVHAAPVD
jgi:peptide/nickel transport system ATP-binding protein